MNRQEADAELEMILEKFIGSLTAKKIMRLSKEVKARPHTREYNEEYGAKLKHCAERMGY